MSTTLYSSSSLHFFTTFFTFFTLSSLISPSHSTQNELTILLTLKSTFIDPSNSLISWSNSSSNHCNFSGVTCSNSPPFTITSLNLQSFNLSGQISSQICYLPNLTSINLSNNLFNLPIPLHFSNCLSLKTLNLSNNQFFGSIPPQISQFKSIEVIDFSGNKLEGEITENIGFLKQLKVLNLGGNFFTGDLPRVFGNFTQLKILDLSGNSFVGVKISDEIGNLGKIEQLLLHNSGFSGVIPENFVNLVNLKVFDVSQNNLTGEIPKNFGEFSKKMESFDVSVNKLSGFYPGKICSGENSIITLDFHSNYFTGEISDENVNNCMHLEKFQVQNNGYFGNFPSKLFLLPKIVLIRGENNKFTGVIPEITSETSMLEQVQIDNNSFTGVIPKSLGMVKTLYRFTASNNHLYGNLPPNFCDSPVMSIINLSQNLLSGEIPEVKKCRKLVSLSLASNSFTGVIPQSLGDLPVLTYLDLSDNNLTGVIPSELEDLKLALFNVSYNRLSGSVPFALLTGLPASYLQGNPGLCGPSFAKPCSNEGGVLHQSGGLTKLAYALMCVAVGAVVLVAAFVFFVFRRRFKKSSVMGGVWQSVFFYPLRISEHDLVMAINDKTAVGTGGTFGKVHVIGLPSGELVAVKKLVNSGNQSYKCLKGEIKTLAKIRHKNIVKILGFCRTDDSIILIYEYLPKGSMGDVIGRPSFQMQWNVRLKIAIGVAQGLAYLHNDYSPNLLHRDLRSTNILLDADFEPKLTDFALDRVVGDSAFQSILAFESPPSCYVAPECKFDRKASEKMDVYSFGVVLLELVTGRLAETSTSEESYLDIVKWVRRKINLADGPHLVLDPRIMNSSKEEMLGVLELGLECTSLMPEKRPSMAEVVRALQTLGSKSSSRYLQVSSNGDSSSLSV